MISIRLMKTIAVTMAFMVLLSSFSLSVENHYCTSQTTNLSSNTKVDRCCITLSKEVTPTPKKNSCCGSKTIKIKGLDQSKLLCFETSATLYTLKTEYYNFENFQERLETPLEISIYCSPIIITDHQLIDQVFII